jgi:muramoyltetrapeptide carboxypeptidase
VALELGATIAHPWSVKVPPPLRPGDRISVVAPSGPFDDDQLREGLARLRDFECFVPDSLWGRRSGFFAGDDSSRWQELQNALDRTDTQAILVARGGYGLGRILPRLDFAGLRRHPKWLIGFSDVTSLHCAFFQQGLASLHAPNGTTLARAQSHDLDSLLGVLRGDLGQHLTGLAPWTHGKAQGPLWGGNLTVLFAEAAAGRLLVPPGAVAFLEDVAETSYRIDRMLSALTAAGCFSNIAGIVLGEFVDCSPGKFDVPATQVLREHFGQLSIPVLAGLPVGHGASNHPLLFGGDAKIDTATGTLTVTSPS